MGSDFLDPPSENTPLAGDGLCISRAGFLAARVQAQQKGGREVLQKVAMLRYG